MTVPCLAVHIALLDENEMDIRHRFPFLRPVLIEDAWPIETQGSIVEFERDGRETTGISVTFRDQPIEMAPKVTQERRGAVAASIEIQDPTQAVATHIVKRFHGYINLFVPVHIDFDEREVEYIPADDQEQAKLGIFSFKSSFKRRSPVTAFSMFAQALYAGESSDDPSFASTLAQMARDAYDSKLYIEAFRYGFLLFEGLYGNGKFKKEQLVEAMQSHAEFVAAIEQNIHAFRADHLHAKSKAVALVTKYRTAPEIIAHLVDRRGFYFHGNIKRRDMWRPDQQEDAEALADFCVFLAFSVANTFGDAMFTPEVTQKYFVNARKQGAVMTVLVKFRARDELGIVKAGSMRVTVPGTVATNHMAIYIQKKFLEWAETELYRHDLISAVAKVEGTGAELFRSQYLVPDAKNGPDSGGAG